MHQTDEYFASLYAVLESCPYFTVRIGCIYNQSQEDSGHQGGGRSRRVVIQAAFLDTSLQFLSEFHTHHSNLELLLLPSTLLGLLGRKGFVCLLCPPPYFAPHFSFNVQKLL